MTQPMLTMAQPMNMAGQIVQTPYGQAFILPSNTTMLNADHGQVYVHEHAQSTPLSQVAVQAVHQQPPVEPNISTPTLETGINQPNTSNANDQTINDSSHDESKEFLNIFK